MTIILAVIMQLKHGQNQTYVDVTQSILSQALLTLSLYLGAYS